MKSFQQKWSICERIIALKVNFLRMCWDGPADPEQWYRPEDVAMFRGAWNRCRKTMIDKWTEAGLTNFQLNPFYSTLYRSKYDADNSKDINYFHFTGAFQQEELVIIKDLQLYAVDIGLNHIWTMFFHGMTHHSTCGEPNFSCLPEPLIKNVKFGEIWVPSNQLEKLGDD